MWSPHQLCAGSVSLHYVVAELSLQLELLEVPRFEVLHLPGRYDCEVSWLARAEDRGEKPQSLENKPGAGPVGLHDRPTRCREQTLARRATAPAFDLGFVVTPRRRHVNEKGGAGGYVGRDGEVVREGGGTTVVQGKGSVRERRGRSRGERPPPETDIPPRGLLRSRGRANWRGKWRPG